MFNGNWMILRNSFSVEGGKHGQQQAEIKVFAHESMQVALHQVQQVCIRYFYYLIIYF